ncbi:MAG: hypothetical protein ABI041_08720, partial [Bdellovibrionia bacterium]
SGWNRVSPIVDIDSQYSTLPIGGGHVLAFGDSGTTPAFLDVTTAGATNLNIGITLASGQIIGEFSGPPAPRIATTGAVHYAAYIDPAHSNKASVRKYTISSSTWSQVGSTGFSAGEVSNISIVYANSKLYALYKDASQGGDATIMIYNGTAWVNLSTNIFGGEIMYPLMHYNSGADTMEVYAVKRSDISKVSNVSVAATLPPALTIATGQAASVVIGQPNFISGSANQGGTAAANTLNFPYINPAVLGGRLYIADGSSSRVLGFNSVPTSNNASADFVLGQPDFVTATGGAPSASAIYPYGVAAFSNGKFAVADSQRARALIYNTAPTATGTLPDVVVGQSAMNVFNPACNSTTTSSVTDITYINGKLIIVDGGHHRILIYNSVPTTNGAAADLVLGQADFVSCNGNRGATVAANTLYYPDGVWTDGTRLAIADSNNHRVLIWNTFPTTNGQNADLVLGQTLFTTSITNNGGRSASSLNEPISVKSNGTQLVVSDRSNARVLIWSSFPTTNKQAATSVLGQTAFTTATQATTQTGMKGPGGLFINGTQLLVVDGLNSRVLIYDGI